jgi:RNA polymerase sigma-70 factor (ECF subfamily)
MSEEWQIRSEASDEELIALFQAGNESAFRTIVSRFKNPLMNYAFRFVGNMDDAQDIVQETFIRLYRNRHAYRPVAKFSTWLYTVSGNLARTHLRRKKLGTIFSIFHRRGEEGEREHEIPDNRYSADRELEQSDTAEIVHQALSLLDSKHREIIILSDIQELSYEEICEITGLKMGTVKSRLNRARAQLKILLKDVADDL